MARKVNLTFSSKTFVYSKSLHTLPFTTFSVPCTFDLKSRLPLLEWMNHRATYIYIQYSAPFIGSFIFVSFVEGVLTRISAWKEKIKFSLFYKLNVYVYKENFDMHSQYDKFIIRPQLLISCERRNLHHSPPGTLN